MPEKNQDPLMQPKVNEPEVKPATSPQVEPAGTPPEMPPLHSNR